MNRRRFLLAMGAFGATANPGRVIVADIGQKNTFERTAKAFGTIVRIVVRHQSKRTAQAAMAEALSELERIESVMSIYRHDSHLSKLNRQGQLDAADPFLRGLIQKAIDFSVQTSGAFDITVQSLWKSYQASAMEGQPPTESSLHDARRAVGFRNVEVVGHRVRLKSGAQVTLNGIAQGFATDRAKRILLQHGINDALIDVGELASLGSKQNGIPWSAGIQHPRREDAFVSITPMDDRCLATSGDYETTFTDDFRVHHIFDPRTGLSPSELASVSVLAPTATRADVLSTSLMVMGLQKGMVLLSKQKKVDALFVRKDGRTYATSGFSIG